MRKIFCIPSSSSKISTRCIASVTRCASNNSLRYRCSRRVGVNRQGQRDFEASAPSRIVGRGNFSAVQPHGRAANRKTQAHADNIVVRAAPLESPEHTFRVAGRNTRSVIRHHEPYFLVPDGGGYGYRRTGGRVLRRILQQVAEHLYYQGGVDKDQRQFGGNLHDDAPFGEAGLATLQGESDQVVDAVPVGVRGALGGFYLHQFENIRQQLRHVACLAFDQDAERGTSVQVECVFRLGDQTACAGDRRQRRSQIVGNRCQQRITQQDTIGGDPRRFSGLCQTGSLQRLSELNREGIQEIELIGGQPRIGMLRTHDNDTPRIAPLQGQVDRVSHAPLFARNYLSREFEINGRQGRSRPMTSGIFGPCDG